MTRSPSWLSTLWQLLGTLCALVGNGMQLFHLCLRSPVALAAENLFLRKQLALYQERQVKPKRAPTVTRFALLWLARWFAWRQALVIVALQE